MALTTRDMVKSHLGLAASDSADDAEIDAKVAAVNALLPTWLDSIEGEHVTLGATMLAAKLVDRRNNPGGVQALAEGGVAYVLRVDPDAAMYLGFTKRWMAPKVGG